MGFKLGLILYTLKKTTSIILQNIFIISFAHSSFSICFRFHAKICDGAIAFFRQVIHLINHSIPLHIKVRPLVLKASGPK